MKSQDSTRFKLGFIQDLCVCVEQETSQGERWIGDAGGDSVRNTGLRELGKGQVLGKEVGHPFLWHRQEGRR